MGVWDQSVFDPIFASVLLRTGWTVSNQERLYGIGTKLWRYRVVRFSLRWSAEVKSAVVAGLPACSVPLVGGELNRIVAGQELKPQRSRTQSAKREAQSPKRLPPSAMRLALCALRFPPSPGVCRLSLGNSERVDGAAIERVVAEEIFLEVIEPLDGHCRRLCGAVLVERRLAAEV